ncbi:MAG: cupin domain-containing protein [Thermaerobacter sp.]|nr:cupin domain-containing protein [Thermaerobacter sp.]
MAQDGAAKVNEREVAWDEERSPKGTYESRYREVSRLLTASPRTEVREGRYPPTRPFEVDLVRIPPHATLCPRHAHSAQWEYYIVLSGSGRMLQDGDAIPMAPGDHLIQPPGWVHTVQNDSEEELLYYVIADNPNGESVYYPDSQKWAFWPPYKLFRMVETDYLDGEE